MKNFKFYRNDEGGPRLQHSVLPCLSKPAKVHLIWVGPLFVQFVR